MCFVALPEANALLFRSIASVDSSFVLRMYANRGEMGINNVFVNTQNDAEEKV
jgi:hypothetical protein